MSMFYRGLLLVVVAALSWPAQAQQRCWVFFADRSGAAPGIVSTQTLAARLQAGLPVRQESDAYPSALYTSAVEAVAGQSVRVRSRWLNAVSIEADAATRHRLAALPFVAEVRPVASTATARAAKDSTVRLGRGLAQVGGAWLQSEGLTGKGITIGLIDAGFGDADRSDELKHLFDKGLIKACRDFEMPSHTDFFRRTSNQIDTHGADVLSLIAGQVPGEGRYGGATDANYYLARTDNAVKEYRREEDLWLNALEWMDSLGVRLINTSLGYALGFDSPSENHAIADVDGHASASTRAVNIATQQKGITVVVSAGNDGGNPKWGIITMPADAEQAIAVGANYLDSWQKLGYSGVGPESLPYVKPDVSAFSLLGTSFSAPVITGLLGCLMERHPGLKPSQYADALRHSGHLAGAPNNYLGYGVPSARRLHLALANTPEPVPVIHLKASHTATVSEGLGAATTVVFFHKKNARTVLQQGTLPVQGGTISLSKPEGAVLTTLATPGHVWEIEWGKK